MLVTDNAELFEYQEEDVLAIQKTGGRTMICLEQGLGKTAESLVWLSRFGAFPAVIVCPAQVKYNWERESERFIGIRPYVCEGRTVPDNSYGFDFQPRLFVCNYDILQEWLPFFLRLGIKTLILDECQYISNAKRKRSAAVRTLAKRCKHFLPLSGTPLMNRTKELYSVLSMVWPSEFPNRLTYMGRYCGPQLTRWGMKYDGASNLDELHKRLKGLGMIRRRKSDVLKDLPDKVWQTEICELTDVEEYKRAEDDFLEWLKSTCPDPERIERAESAEGLTRTGYLRRLCAKLKLKAVVYWARDFLENNPDEKLILFAHHHEAISVLERRIKTKSVTIDGNLIGRKRQAAIDQFQKDPETRLCIGSSAAYSGVNLTAASWVGIVELPWRPGDVSQMVDRAHRVGQKGTVFCTFFVARDTIEERVVHLLQSKQETVSTILDGGLSDQDHSIYHELIQTIRGGIA